MTVLTLGIANLALSDSSIRVTVVPRTRAIIHDSLTGVMARSGVYSAITVVHQWHPQKSRLRRTRPPPLENKRKKNSFIPNLEKLVSLCERIFASQNSETLLASDHTNNRRKVGREFSSEILFSIGVSNLDMMFLSGRTRVLLLDAAAGRGTVPR